MPSAEQRLSQQFIIIISIIIVIIVITNSIIIIAIWSEKLLYSRQGQDKDVYRNLEGTWRINSPIKGPIKDKDVYRNLDHHLWRMTIYQRDHLSQTYPST